MKICLVSNLYPPNARGGAELVASRMANALYERGHTVSVLTTQPYDGIRSLFPRIVERTLGVVYRFFPLNVYYMLNDRNVWFPLRLVWHVIDLFSPFARSAMLQVIKDEEPDVVITHNLKGLGISVGAAIQKKGVRHVHVLHDVQLTVPSGLLLHGHEHALLNFPPLRSFYERLVMFAIGNPHRVISPSQFLADVYVRRGMFKNSKIEILPNPLPPGTKPSLPSDRPKRRTQFIFVGQLEAHKGIYTLLDVMDMFGDEVQLHIAGEGSLAEMVTQRASTDKRVFYHGFVPLEYLNKLLESADAVVVPSICYENSPTVIYEAFILGVPVVASRIGGIPELVEDGENGILVTPGSVSELRGAFEQIHRERETWWKKSDTISQNAQKYSIDVYMDKLEQLLKTAS